MDTLHIKCTCNVLISDVCNGKMGPPLKMGPDEAVTFLNPARRTSKQISIHVGDKKKNRSYLRR